MQSKKEFNIRRTAHVKTKSIVEGFANRPIERYHNEVRAVLKSKRGLGNDKSAQVFEDAQRIYHNFCRPHTGLPNSITPAQAGGLFVYVLLVTANALTTLCTI